MKDFHAGGLYRSGWRPLVHEDEESPRTNHNKLKTTVSPAAVPAPVPQTEPQRLAEPTSTVKLEELLLELSRIGEKLDAVCKCAEEQSAKIDRLLELANTQAAADSSPFHLFKNRRQSTSEHT